MRKMFVFLGIIMCSGLVAQNRSIEFIHEDLSEAKSEATAQGKLIFVDAYTTWCGPCKWMAKHMFTNDTIADFFNHHFVNLKMDMEKGEGIDMAKKFGIRSYPTLLILDAEGNMLHRSSGASRQVAPYIQFALQGMNPLERMGTFDKLWAEGKRDGTFTREYLKRREEAYLDNTEIVKSYYEGLSDEEMLSQTTWDVIFNYDQSIDSRGMENLLAQRMEYNMRYGEQKVDERLYENYNRSLKKYLYSPDYNQQKFEELKKAVNEKAIPFGDKIILEADLQLLDRNKDYKGYCELAVEQVGDHFNENANKLNEVAWNVFEWSKKKKELEVALTWAERAVKIDGSPVIRDTYANLLYAVGRKEEARVQEQKAIDDLKAMGEDTSEFESVLESFK